MALCGDSCVGSREEAPERFARGERPMLLKIQSVITHTSILIEMLTSDPGRSTVRGSRD